MSVSCRLVLSVLVFGGFGLCCIKFSRSLSYRLHWPLGQGGQRAADLGGFRRRKRRSWLCKILISVRQRQDCWGDFVPFKKVWVLCYGALTWSHSLNVCRVICRSVSGVFVLKKKRQGACAVCLERCSQALTRRGARRRNKKKRKRKRERVQKWGPLWKSLGQACRRGDVYVNEGSVACVISSSSSLSSSSHGRSANMAISSEPPLDDECKYFYSNFTLSVSSVEQDTTKKVHDSPQKLWRTMETMEDHNTPVHPILVVLMLKEWCFNWVYKTPWFDSWQWKNSFVFLSLVLKLRVLQLRSVLLLLFLMLKISFSNKMLRHGIILKLEFLSYDNAIVSWLSPLPLLSIMFWTQSHSWNMWSVYQVLVANIVSLLILLLFIALKPSLIYMINHSLPWGNNKNYRHWKTFFMKSERLSKRGVEWNFRPQSKCLCTTHRI